MDEENVIAKQRRIGIQKRWGSASIVSIGSGRSNSMNSDKLNSYKNKIISKSIILR